METIGLIAAMPQESKALLRCLGKWKRISFGGLPSYEFQTGGRKCVLVTSGMGLRRAGEAARILLERVSPQILISFGVAGAVRADLHIGDVVAIQATCLLERGNPGPFLHLSSLSAPAQKAASEALRASGAKMVCGTAVTTRGSQMAHLLPEIAHPVLEMETIGIARVAEEQGIPLLALRAVSDGPQAPLPFNLEELMDEKDNLRIGMLLKTALRHPGLIFQSIRMGRNMERAAQNAAAALAAAVSQPSALL